MLETKTPHYNIIDLVLYCFSYFQLVYITKKAHVNFYLFILRVQCSQRRSAVSKGGEEHVWGEQNGMSGNEEGRLTSEVTMNLENSDIVTNPH
jgi:hypothetical protein